MNKLYVQTLESLPTHWTGMQESKQVRDLNYAHFQTDGILIRAKLLNTKYYGHCRCQLVIVTLLQRRNIKLPGKYVLYSVDRFRNRWSTGYGIHWYFELSHINPRRAVFVSVITVQSMRNATYRLHYGGLIQFQDSKILNIGSDWKSIRICSILNEQNITAVDI